MNHKKIIVHIVYATSFLLSVLSIILFLVWSHKEQAKHAQIELAQLQAKENKRKADLALCLLTASKQYTTDWIAACREQAVLNKSTLAACIKEKELLAKSVYSGLKEGKNTLNFWIFRCKQEHTNIEFKPNCSLHQAMANNLAQQQNANEASCREFFS